MEKAIGDIGVFRREHYSSEDPSYWFFTNIEDPNDRGYDAIRRVFLNTILDHQQNIQRINQAVGIGIEMSQEIGWGWNGAKSAC